MPGAAEKNAASSTPRVFIDGQQGSTGLRITSLLEGRNDLTLVTVEEAHAVLCLPDQAAAEALAWLDETDTRVIDTSSAGRIEPGCYPQTVILGVRPLIEAGHLDPALPFTVNAVSGYSGGGRRLVEGYRAQAPLESGDASLPFCLHGLGKGASGNAARCLNIMLGLPESAGLEGALSDRAA